MSKKTEILALIPARSGSKTIPDKNIRDVAGKPLLSYSIGHGFSSELVSRVIVSTDSRSYAEMAINFGAEVPFIRPFKLAQDHSTDLQVFEHALKWLNENEGYKPEICVHLRPTYPVRKVSDIDAMINVLAENPELDSIRSISPAPDSPYKMWFRNEQGTIKPVIEDAEIPDACNEPRQTLPFVYLQNACIDVVRTSVITEMHSMTGDRIYGYLMDDNFDIDFEDQLLKAEEKLTTQSKLTSNHPPITSPNDKSYKFVFDIDGVIAKYDTGLNYDNASPNLEMIGIINFLYSQGHSIVLFTARGSETGIDWRKLTESQMKSWGVNHHELAFGKPSADFALLHCIGQYPTPNEAVGMSFLTRMKRRYPGIPLGYSGHEDPENVDVATTAVSKGAKILERHVGLNTDVITLNKYSMNPSQIEKWVESALRARLICGDENDKTVTQQEIDSLNSLKRGVYANKDIEKGAVIQKNDVFFAMPCLEGQINSGKYGQYRTVYVASKNYKSGEPICDNAKRDKISSIRSVILDAKGMLFESGIALGNDRGIELSHHYGLDHFRQTGAVIVNMINRDYCKKLIILLPSSLSDF